VIRAAVVAAVAVAGGLPGPALDPARLDPPSQGIVVRAGGGVVLVDLGGHVLGHLRGFRVDEVGQVLRRPREVLLRSGRTEYALGGRGLGRVPRLRGGWPRTRTGCHPGPRPFVICGYPWSRPARASTIFVHGRRLLGPLPSPAGRRGGYWVSVELSPDRRTLLLQWEGECETLTAYLARADGTRLRPAVGSRSTESAALGWTRRARRPPPAARRVRCRLRAGGGEPAGSAVGAARLRLSGRGSALGLGAFSSRAPT
jgi:hypothetical protein